VATVALLTTTNFLVLRHAIFHARSAAARPREAAPGRR
jgi:hypothetical protein